MIAEKERQWDKLLRIKTTGRDDSKADQYHYPYGPRPMWFWNVLQEADISEREIS